MAFHRRSRHHRLCRGGHAPRRRRDKPWPAPRPRANPCLRCRPERPWTARTGQAGLPRASPSPLTLNEPDRPAVACDELESVEKSILHGGCFPSVPVAYRDADRQTPRPPQRRAPTGHVREFHARCHKHRIEDHRLPLRAGIRLESSSVELDVPAEFTRECARGRRGPSLADSHTQLGKRRLGRPPGHSSGPSSSPERLAGPGDEPEVPDCATTRDANSRKSHIPRTVVRRRSIGTFEERLFLW